MANPNLGGFHQEELYEEFLLGLEREKTKSLVEGEEENNLLTLSSLQRGWNNNGNQDEAEWNPFQSETISQSLNYQEQERVPFFGVSNQASHSHSSYDYSQFNDPTSLGIAPLSTQGGTAKPYQLTAEHYRSLLQQQSHGHTTDWYPNPALLPSAQSQPQPYRHSVPSLDSFSTSTHNRIQSHQSFLPANLDPNPQSLSSQQQQQPWDAHFRSQSFSYGDASHFGPSTSSSLQSADRVYPVEQDRADSYVHPRTSNQFLQTPSQSQPQPQPRQSRLKLTHSKGKGKQRAELQGGAAIQEVDEEGLEVDEGASKKRKTVRRQEVVSAFPSYKRI